MSDVSLCLWFDGQAEEAATFYVDAFRACGRSASIDRTAYWPAGLHGPAGGVLTVEFTLDGQEIMALNGGPQYQPTPAASIMVHCRDQAELDAFWARLGEGGQPVQCGWLTDRYGVSWQIAPKAMGRMMSEGTPEQVGAVMRAFMPMVKLELAPIEQAYAEAGKAAA